MAPAQCTTALAPSTRRLRLPGSSRRPSHHSSPSSPWAGRHRGGNERQSARTVQPAFSSRFSRAAPMNPVAPVRANVRDMATFIAHRRSPRHSLVGMIAGECFFSVRKDGPSTSGADDSAAQHSTLNPPCAAGYNAHPPRRVARSFRPQPAVRSPSSPPIGKAYLRWYAAECSESPAR